MRDFFRPASSFSTLTNELAEPQWAPSLPLRKYPRLTFFL